VPAADGMPHPHMRGEYFHTSHPGMCAAGSSPRAWGILRARRQIYCIFRFIPTCVGNTVPGNRDERLDPVHPHVRGEYASMLMPSMSLVGSSPRAWGIQSPRIWTVGQERFIPTCVGNTVTAAPAGDAFPVHPHVRGEYAT